MNVLCRFLHREIRRQEPGKFWCPRVQWLEKAQSYFDMWHLRQLLIRPFCWPRPEHELHVNFWGFFSLAKMPTIPNRRDGRVETRRWQDIYSFLVVKFKLESTLSLKFPFKTGQSSLLYSCLNENREFSQQKVRGARDRAPRLHRGTRADNQVTGATQKCFISYDLLLTNDAALWWYQKTICFNF